MLGATVPLREGPEILGFDGFCGVNAALAVPERPNGGEGMRLEGAALPTDWSLTKTTGPFGGAVVVDTARLAVLQWKRVENQSRVAARGAVCEILRNGCPAPQTPVDRPNNIRIPR